MSLLYDEQQERDLASNGDEELTPQQNPHLFAHPLEAIGVGLSNAKVGTQRILQSSDETAASALGFNAYLTPDQRVAKIVDITPTPPAELPKFQHFDPTHLGKADIVLGGFTQQLPTVLSAIVNPLAGFSMGAAMGAQSARAEGEEMGLKGNALQAYSVTGSAFEGAGALVPGVEGVGASPFIKFGTKFLFGGAINNATSMADRWGRAGILDEYGYHQQAEQMRDYDFKSALTDFLTGAAMATGGDIAHAGFKRIIPHVSQPAIDAATVHSVDDHFVTETAPGLATTPEAESAHARTMTDAAAAVDSGNPVSAGEHFENGHEFIVPADFPEREQAIHDALYADKEHISDRQEVQARGEEYADIDATPLKENDPDPTYAGKYSQPHAQPVEQAEAGTIAPAESNAAENGAQTAETPQQKEARETGYIAPDYREPDLFAGMRAEADSLATQHPELAAEMHEQINTLEQAHNNIAAEASAYDVAAACALSFGE